MPSEYEIQRPYPPGVETTFPLPLNYHASCICVLKNGFIVIGSLDGTLGVWNPSTPALLQVVQGHTSGVNSVCALGDGRIVSGSQDKTLRICNINDNVCLQVLEGHTSYVSSVCALDTPAGQRIVSGSGDNTLRVWDSATGACLRVLEGHTSNVECVCALDTPAGQGIVSGSYDNTLRVWDSATGACLRVLEGHTWHVTSVCALDTPMGQRIVSGSRDGTLRVWDSATGICLRVLKGHTSTVCSVCVLDTPAGQRIVSGSYDKTLRVWDINKDNPKILKILTDNCFRVAKLSPTTFVSVSSYISIWNISNLDSFPRQNRSGFFRGIQNAWRRSTLRGTSSATVAPAPQAESIVTTVNSAATLGIPASSVLSPLTLRVPRLPLEGGTRKSRSYKRKSSIKSKKHKKFKKSRR